LLGNSETDILATRFSSTGSSIFPLGAEITAPFASSAVRIRFAIGIEKRMRKFSTRPPGLPSQVSTSSI
jgi:hypothetical protein